MTRSRHASCAIPIAGGIQTTVSATCVTIAAVQSFPNRSVDPPALDSPGYAEEVWVRLQEFLLRRRSAALRRELQKMNPVTDPRYDEMFQRLIAADGELRRLRERGHDAAWTNDLAPRP